MSGFSFFKKNKMENRMAKQVFSWGLVPLGVDVRKGWRRVNVVEILCTSACKWIIFLQEERERE
jgi:hypothetical protein